MADVLGAEVRGPCQCPETGGGSDGILQDVSLGETASGDTGPLCVIPYSSSFLYNNLKMEKQKLNKISQTREQALQLPGHAGDRRRSGRVGWGVSRKGGRGRSSNGSVLSPDGCSN